LQKAGSKQRFQRTSEYAEVENAVHAA